MIFIFNFGQNSIDRFEFYPQDTETYKIKFSSDDEIFGGYNRIDKKVQYQANWEGKMAIYIPSRMCMVLRRNKN